MASLKPIIDPSEFKTSFLHNKPVFLKYDRNFDALMIFFDNPRQRAVVHYLDDYVALLFSPVSKEIIGIQVEAFEKAFIQKHSTIENAWRLSENCQDHNIKDIGDMMFLVQVRQEPIIKEVRDITENLLFNQRNDYAFA
jgi:hypothetical protein